MFISKSVIENYPLSLAEDFLCNRIKLIVDKFSTLQLLSIYNACDIIRLYYKVIMFEVAK